MRIKLFITVLIWSIVGFILIGKNIQAEFSIIDDHEIASYLDGKERIGLNSAQDILGGTEFYSFGSSPRFRPIFYLLKVTETFLWGNNPLLWYAARFWMFVFSFSLMWLLLKRYVGWLIGFLLLLLTLTFTYWIDIWTRLGTSELYCVPSLAVFLIAYVNLLQDKGKRNVNWFFLLCSVVVMIGSKETFAFLLPFIIYLDGYLIMKRELHGSGLFISLLAILWILYVLIGVGVYVVQHGGGVDFYQNGISIGLRASNILYHVIYIWTKIYHFGIVGITALSVFSFWLWKKTRTLPNVYKMKLKKALQNIACLCLLIVTLLFSQLYFYNGMWPVNMRYDFPGMLVVLLALIIVYRFFLLVFEILKYRTAFYWWPYVFASLLVMEISFIGYKPLIVASWENVRTTTEFSKRIVLIKEDLDKDKTIPVVYESCSPWDMEPIVSVTRFLHQSLISRDVFIRTGGYAFATTENLNLGKKLANDIKIMSIKGTAGFKPIEELDTKKECYAILFSCVKSLCKQSR